MASFTWTQKNDKFLTKNHGVVFIKDIAKKFGVSKYAVNKRIKELGLRRKTLAYRMKEKELLENFDKELGL